MDEQKTYLPHCLNNSDLYKEIVNIQNRTNEQYFIVSLDFDDFNYINDFFGENTGKSVLNSIMQHFSNELSAGESFSQIYSDMFLLLLKSSNADDVVKRISIITNLEDIILGILPKDYNLICYGGVMAINSQNPAKLIDNANYAKKRAKNRKISTFMVYNKQMEDDLTWRKTVALTMEDALNNNEFEIYLQPKASVKTQEIVGAEALARWNNKQYGLIYPNKFIEIFEENGFIKKLDFYMLEQVCIFLKYSLENNIPLLPISVNFSKYHLQNEEFVSQVYEVANKYNIPTKFIEIEFTESAFTTDFQAFFDVIGGLKYLGFKISLDDFGGTYSSLNCLKNVPLDIIKIDSSLLQGKTENDKEDQKIIIAKIVELIKSLRIISVMEGVETKEQVEFLQKLSCDIMQGYFYSKPMDVTKYIEYIKTSSYSQIVFNQNNAQNDNNHKDYLYTLPEEFQMDNWELYTLGKNINMGLMKGYLDGEATVQYVNDKALEYIGYTRQEFKDVFHNSIVAFTHPDDAHIVQTNANQLVTTGKPLEFQTRAIRKDGKIVILKGQSSCVIDSSGRPVGLYAFQDVTNEIEEKAKLEQAIQQKIHLLETKLKEERKINEALLISEERYRIIVEQSNDIIFEWDFKNDSLWLSDKYERLFGRKAIGKNLTTDTEVRGRVHHDDIGVFEDIISNTYQKNIERQGEFRIMTADGVYIWVRAKVTTISDSSGNPVKAVGTFSNIDKQRHEIDELTDKSQRDPLTKLYNKEELRKRIESALVQSSKLNSAFIMVDIDDFKNVNDNFGHQFGDTVLSDVAKTIISTFRETDILGRIGGDEMVIFMQDYHGTDILSNKVNQLIESLNKIYSVDNATHTLSISVGVACCPKDGATFSELYKKADDALYKTKNSGKNGYTFYGTY